MHNANHRILSSFDWFVLIVILGYLLGMVQCLTHDGTHWLPFTPSSQLWYDGLHPPTEPPWDTAVSLGPSRSALSDLS